MGIKELWEIPAGRVAKGEVIYTLGYPLTWQEYGGAWIYGISDTLLSVGYVVGLDYQDPRLDPHHVFQSFKEHSLVRPLLEGGKMVRYGAKSLPYGGWLTMPKLAGKGWMILGDSASLLNSQRLKGIHLAIKSGMLAAETAFESMRVGDNSSAALGAYQSRVEGSWIKEELYPVRNFHQGFEHGLLPGPGAERHTAGAGRQKPWPRLQEPRRLSATCATWMPSADRPTAAKRRWGRRRATENSPSTS